MFNFNPKIIQEHYISTTTQTPHSFNIEVVIELEERKLLTLSKLFDKKLSDIYTLKLDSLIYEGEVTKNYVKL